MRRIPAVVLGVLAVAALAVTAGTAFADEGSTATTAPPSRGKVPVAIHLTCSEANGSITCSWDAYDGATGYRVIGAFRHGKRGVIRAHEVSTTTFTIPAKRAGQYHFVVQALGGDGKPVARSNRAHVTVKKAAADPSTTSTTQAG